MDPNWETTWSNRIEELLKKLNDNMIVVPRPFFNVENFKAPQKPTVCALLCALAEDDPNLYHDKIKEAYHSLHQQYHNGEQ